jgi:hypothetical protein
MLTYKQKFLNEISELPEAQVKKFYLLFDLLMKEFVTENNGTGNWKDDFKNISVWKDDDFDEIQKGFSQWKIAEF